MKDSRQWLSMSWLDRYSTKTFRITTKGDSGDRVTARVSTYAEVIADYEFHPEQKCADARGVEHDSANVHTEYRDPRRSDWMRKTLPVVKAAKLVA